MPQLELTRGEYGLEGEIRLPAWEHWQIQEQARPIRVDFGGDRVEEGLELTEAFLVLTEDVLQAEETGSIQIEGGSWRAYRLKRSRALQAGEAVALLRADGGQQYLVLGRVRKEG